ncbi:thioredoxin domain-containing protein [Methanothermobacter sp.]|uniref:thioredoxin domain-containing protein n=1 Tax=Methanothermobacter sp. TaxID=1884223 RepID=UPI0026161165|nr:thioredoxin domain-containing protein [Methanothermobacter sp.]MDI9614166.1 thioredoxin domain-containing protein [Methanothermobacter sp.]
MKGKEFTNSLINEKSPYLLQHAHHPVNWYPWGDEAFQLAREGKKPIFLSIGYSTCHWCHVMARESFEDPEIAGILNENFVAVKVDREERPDIDAIYMKVCQMMTGTGGWPLTIIMTPEGEPFFAGTYFPPDDRGGVPGLRTILERVVLLWKNAPEGIVKTAREVVSALKKSVTESSELKPETVDAAYEYLRRNFDARNGGFGSYQKFPTPHNIYFLLRYHLRRGDDESLRMVNLTLRRMRYGGIYDQLGYGFHRYAVEPTWTVPHFEKMLYDQALILKAYLEAFQVTCDDLYKQTSLEIVEYVLGNLQSPEGAFYSAEDAESEGVEGKYYLWRASEIREALGDEADVVMRYFNVLEDGNFACDMRGENILHIGSPEMVADEFDLTPGELNEIIEQARRALLERRMERPAPAMDDKILTDWNGLMLGALAACGRILDSKEALAAAKRCLKFIMNNLHVDDELLHRYRDGEAGIDGKLDDYAFLIWGLLELYDATFREGYVDMALELSESLEDRFGAPHGGFYSTDDPRLIVRPMDATDGVIPSGNSVQMLNLLRLGGILEDDDLTESARGVMGAFAGDVESAPAAHTFLLSNLEWALSGGRSLTIVCSGKPVIPLELRKKLIPDFTMTVMPRDWPTAPPHLRDKGAPPEGCAYYLCDGRRCYPPLNDPMDVMEHLGVI